MENKLVLLDEKYSEIERENQMLLSKIKNILRNKAHSEIRPNFEDGFQSERIKSLNFRERKQFLKDITKINRKFLVTLNNVKSQYKFSDDQSNSWGTSRTKQKNCFVKRKKSLNKMFKTKRRESNYDGKLPMINSIQTDNNKLMSTRGIEKFSTFDSMVRSSQKKPFQNSVNKSNARTRISRSRNRSKMSMKYHKTERKPQPIPFIVKRYNRGKVKRSLDKSRSNKGLSRYFSLAEKLMKKGKIFV